MFPLVRDLAAEGIPVAVTCRVLKLSRGHYYRWMAQPITNVELEEAYRAHALWRAHLDDPEFGYRFLHDEAGDAGVVMAARTAWRICGTPARRPLPSTSLVVRPATASSFRFCRSPTMDKAWDWSILRTDSPPVTSAWRHAASDWKLPVAPCSTVPCNRTGPTSKSPFPGNPDMAE